MPELREVFEMTTKQMGEPDVDSWREQEKRQRNANRNKKVGVFALAAAIVLVAVVWIVGIREGEDTTTPADESGTTAPDRGSGPFSLDLRMGEKTPLSEAIVPEGVGYGVSVFYQVSPDGTRIAYNTCHFGGCSTADEMAVADIDGSDVRNVRLPEGLNGYAPHWSPDGTKIVYQLRRGSASDHPDLGNLFVQDLSSGQTTQLTDLELTTAGWWFMSPSFSPDGRSVIFHLARDSSATTKFDVWSVPVTGGEPTLVLRNALFPMVLPDGEIAFVTPSGVDLTGGRISIADAEGSRRTLVEANVAIVFPTMSPDGSRIAYRDGGSIYVVDVSTGESSKVADGAYDNAAWLDDDTLIVTP
jgi:Tol biopolymer transport system component